MENLNDRAMKWVTSEEWKNTKKKEKPVFSYDKFGNHKILMNLDLIGRLKGERNKVKTITTN